MGRLGGGGEDHAGLDGVVVPYRLQVDGHDQRRAHLHERGQDLTASRRSVRWRGDINARTHWRVTPAHTSSTAPLPDLGAAYREGFARNLRILSWQSQEPGVPLQG